MLPNVLTQAGAAALCAAAFMVTGCASTIPPSSAAPMAGPTEHYKAEVEEVPDQLALGVHGAGLSPRQQSALGDFVARWRDAGSGVITLKVPGDAGRPADAKAMTYAVRAEMLRLGVPVEDLQFAGYMAGAANGPVVASFVRLAAKVADCTTGWGNLSSTNDNEPFSHFGCAVTANAALQIADPRELVAPPGLAPGDNVRRQVILNKYRDGKTTSSDKDSQANGAASSVSTQ